MRASSIARRPIRATRVTEDKIRHRVPCRAQHAIPWGRCAAFIYLVIPGAGYSRRRLSQEEIDALGVLPWTMNDIGPTVRHQRERGVERRGERGCLPAKVSRQITAPFSAIYQAVSFAVLAALDVEDSRRRYSRKAERFSNISVKLA